MPVLSECWGGGRCGWGRWRVVGEVEIEHFTAGGKLCLSLVSVGVGGGGGTEEGGGGL